jgi:hypothetical protein
MDSEEAFPPGLLKRITNLYVLMHDVLPVSNLNEWIGGFVDEKRPENEVRIHEAVAVVYLSVLDGLKASQQQKKHLYTVLVLVASGMTVRHMEQGLPDAAPGHDELLGRWKQAFAAGQRPVPRYTSTNHTK